MGIDTGSMLIVGLFSKDMPEAIREEISENGHYETIGEDSPRGLESASPYYDSPPDARVWGIRIAGVTWDAQEVPGNYVELIEAARVKFRELIGAEPKLYVSANVW